MNEDRGRPPIARLLGAGAKGAERVAHATGVDMALEDAVEEAIVRALRSPAVERAIVRVIERNAVQDAIGEALTSDQVADAIIQALESEAADRVWVEILAGDKAQMLVERIAQAPEVRAAIASQGAGLITDIGVRLTVITEALDDAAERIVHRMLRRDGHEEETHQAGLVTRAVAAAVDAALLGVLFSLGSSVLASVVPFATGAGGGLSLPAAITLGTVAFLLGGGIVVAFWALAGQTPGMRFLSIRLHSGGSPEIGVRRAVGRLLGVLVALAPLGLGLLAILVSPRRRGWHDRLAGTEVVYEDARRQAPHAGRPGAGTSAQTRAS